MMVLVMTSLFLICLIMLCFAALGHAVDVDPHFFYMPGYPKVRLVLQSICIARHVHHTSWVINIDFHSSLFCDLQVAVKVISCDPG